MEAATPNRTMRLIATGQLADLRPDSSFAVFGLPFSDNGRFYYETISSASAHDLSFGYADSDGLAMYVGCNNSDPDRLSCFESPIELWTRSGLSISDKTNLVKKMLGELQSLARQHEKKVIVLRTQDASPSAEASILRLLTFKIAPVVSLDAFVDLTQSDEQIVSGMRSGHRQQVRWGERHVNLLLPDPSGEDSTLCNQFQALHAEVSGRITRPQASWDAMNALINRGHGDLILSALDGQIMGGTLIIDADGTSYYASGAYRRDHFDKPLSHFSLFTAMQRSRARGNTRFMLGEVGHFDPAMPEKELGIGWFKAGFTSTASASLIWTIPITPRNGPRPFVR